MFTESMKRNIWNVVFRHHSPAQQRTRSKHSHIELEKISNRMTEILRCGSAITTLKDFNNAKNPKLINPQLFNVTNLLSFGKNEHQYISKTRFKFYIEMLNNARATDYQMTIPLDSKAAIGNLSRN